MQLIKPSLLLLSLVICSCDSSDGTSNSELPGGDAGQSSEPQEPESCVEVPTCGTRECGVVNGCERSVDCGSCESDAWCSEDGLCQELPGVDDVENKAYSVFVVHLEPATERGGSSIWENGLVPMVEAADAARIPLSIFMQAQWVDYVLDPQTCTYHPGYSSCVEMMRSWIDSDRETRHEIGMHNHGPAHAKESESGYSEWDAQHAEDVRLGLGGKGVFPDTPNGTFLELHRGSLGPVVQRLENDLLGGVEIKSGTIMQPWHESPNHIRYETSARSGGSGVNSRIVHAQVSGAGGLHETYPLTSAICTRNCAQGVQTWKGMEPDQVFVITTHGHNFQTGENRADIEAFFLENSSVDPNNDALRRRTLSDVMENVVLPSDYTTDGFCGDGFCDAVEACPVGVENNAEDACDPYQLWAGANAPSCAADCYADMPGSGTGDGAILLDVGAVLQSDGSSASYAGTLEFSDQAQGQRHVRLQDASSSVTLDTSIVTGMRRIEVRGRSSIAGEVQVDVQAQGSTICSVTFGVSYSVQTCSQTLNGGDELTITGSNGDLFIDSVALPPTN